MLICRCGLLNNALLIYEPWANNFWKMIAFVVVFPAIPHFPQLTPYTRGAFGHQIDRFHVEKKIWIQGIETGKMSVTTS